MTTAPLKWPRACRASRSRSASAEIDGTEGSRDSRTHPATACAATQDLMGGDVSIAANVSLVRSGPSHDGSMERLRSRLADLQSLLTERAAALAGAQADLAAFRLRYRQDVGLLHEELDELDRAIAEAELGELSKLVEDSGASAAPGPAGRPPEPAARFTSDAVRRLFRDVAKTIHPDLARDEEARD